MPAAAVIPAPIAYIKVVAVKKLVVGSRAPVLFCWVFRTGGTNNRSVMPLDVRGRTCTTMKAATCVRAPPERVGEPAEPPLCQGSGLVIFARERGILSKRESPAHVDQVPALCTHRPSLLPIGRFSEALGLRRGLARRGSGPPGRHGAAGRRPNLTF